MRETTGWRHISPLHIARDGWEREKAIKAEHELPSYALPNEAGWRDGMEIYAVRLTTMAKCMGSMVLLSPAIAAVGVTAETVVNGLH